jgi:hypothetical protein
VEKKEIWVSIQTQLYMTLTEHRKENPRPCRILTVSIDLLDSGMAVGLKKSGIKQA